MAIDPVSASIGAAASLVKGLTGTAQFIKGNRVLKGIKRPTYEIPSEIAKNLSISERMALEGLPEEQRKQYIDNLNRQTGSVLSGFTSRKAGLTGLTNLTQTQSDAFRNLMVEDAAAKQQNQLAAMQQRNIMASYRDKAFEYNKAQPYEQKLAEGQALQGAGLQNIFNGVDELAGTALMAGVGQGDNKSMDKGDYSQYDPNAINMLSSQVGNNWQSAMMNRYKGLPTY